MRHDLDALVIRLFARALRNSGRTVAGFSCIVAACTPFFVPLELVMIWLGVQALLLGLAHRLAAGVLDRPEETVATGLWRRRFIGLEVLRGLVWGALAGHVIATSQHAAAAAFGLTTILSASAMVATIAASIPAAVAGAMGAMSAIGLLALFNAGLDLDILTLAVLVCCAQLYLFRIAGRLHATALETLSIQDEKDRLIAELAGANATSDLARRHAEAANLAKSRFLAAMSHELRTPLNAILGFAEVMKGELFGAHSVASYKEYSSDIHASGEHLLGLINEILDLSRIEAGRRDLEEDAVRLINVVEDCKHILALRAKSRNLLIDTIAEPHLPPLRADERAIRQVVLNLLSNAMCFSPHGGEITFKIGWTARGGQYLSVRDNGPGIPEEELAMIMTPFGRGTLARENGEQGTGLGLAIVKGLVELHGGSVILRSRLHAGTEVIVIFPTERVTTLHPAGAPDVSAATAV
jgi:two-component system cell cycle sensor histidine kinase PleC